MAYVSFDNVRSAARWPRPDPAIDALPVDKPAS